MHGRASDKWERVQQSANILKSHPALMHENGMLVETQELCLRQIKA